MSLIEINSLETNIRLRKGEVKAVAGISLKIEEGETLGLVGESGCGKTMTGMSIMRLLPPGGYIAGGSILFNGEDLAALSEEELRKIRGNEIGMIFQDPMTSLNPCMTVGNQISETVLLHRGSTKNEAKKRVLEVLDLVGMPKPIERINDYPHQLSGGLRQRVMIAMALACEPKLLIADEPTTALDVTIQAQILELLDDLKQQLGMAMLLITHDMGVIAGRADRVAVMYAGRIIEEARTDTIFVNPNHPYSEALLGSIPRINATTSRLYSIPGLPPDLSRPIVGCSFAPRCRLADDTCRQFSPDLSKDDDHRYACFHPVGIEALRVEIRSNQNDRLEIDWQKDLEPLMVLDHVSKEFVVTKGTILQRKAGTLKAVTDISMKIYKGETLGIVGESGCGKSTTGAMLVAMEQPTSGTVTFEGSNLNNLSSKELRAMRHDLQLMFQDPYASLDPRMRVGSIIREPLDINKIGSKSERNNKVASLLEEVGLNPRSIERYPHEFSGGQRQRIGLARALALNPKLIVADEPVSALDVSIRSQVLNLMKDLQKAHHLTYVVISHDLSVVRFLADRVGVMYLGKLVEIGSGYDIYENCKHPYTAALLSAVPIADPALEKLKERRIIQGELPSAINPPSGCRFRTRCTSATSICSEVEPLMTSYGSTHLAACHHPVSDPIKVSSSSESPLD